ncbi:MAG: hypothetical protein HC895_06390 [Leptolyngbyaceae cyanobacterium SM1_3_5]|nr:hypothetical protein [Leptolyngbyaceae cyanobacterium SM1_3_5]
MTEELGSAALPFQFSLPDENFDRDRSGEPPTPRPLQSHRCTFMMPL